MTVPPSAIRLTDSRNRSISVTRFFSRYPTPTDSVPNSSVAYSRSTYWLSTSTPVSGNRRLIDRAASRPSVVWVGGIRTSTIARFGRRRATARSSSCPSPTEATTEIPSSSSRLRTPSRSSTASSASTTVSGSSRDSVQGDPSILTSPCPTCAVLGGWVSAMRDLRSHSRARPGRAVDHQSSIERAHPPGQTLQSAAALIGASGTVVDDLGDEHPVAIADRDRNALRLRMFDDIGHGLPDHEVDGGFDLRGQSLLRCGHHRDRDRAPIGHAVEHRRQAVVVEGCGVDPPRDLARFVDEVLGLGECIVEQPSRLLRVLSTPSAGDEHRQGHDVLLHPVMEIPFDPAALIVDGHDHAA